MTSKKTEVLLRGLAAKRSLSHAAETASMTDDEAIAVLLRLAGEPEADSPHPLLRATDVARFCGVDLKTIHNWCDKGQIKFFRTPGMHLRFRAESVREFLVSYGYPIPPELAKVKP